MEYTVVLKPYGPVVIYSCRITIGKFSFDATVEAASEEEARAKIMGSIEIK